MADIDTRVVAATRHRDEVDSDPDLCRGHPEHGDQHQEPSADQVLEDEAEEGGHEVGEADDEGAVLGGD